MSILPAGFIRNSDGALINVAPAPPSKIDEIKEIKNRLDSLEGKIDKLLRIFEGDGK